MQYAPKFGKILQCEQICFAESYNYMTETAAARHRVRDCGYIYDVVDCSVNMDVECDLKDIFIALTTCIIIVSTKRPGSIVLRLADSL